MKTFTCLKKGVSGALGFWIKRVNATYILINLDQDLELWVVQTSTVYMAMRGLTGTQGLLDKKGLMQPISTES